MADATRDVDAIWARCHVWELTPAVCDSAAAVAPRHRLRTLDALHLATYLEARRRLGDVELVTADKRLEEPARACGRAERQGHCLHRIRMAGFGRP